MLENLENERNIPVGEYLDLFLATQSIYASQSYSVRATGLEQVLPQFLCFLLLDIRGGSQEFDCLLSIHGFEQVCQSEETPDNFAGPTGLQVGSLDNDLLLAICAGLELFRIVDRLLESRACVKRCAKNPIHNFPAFMTSKRQYSRIAHMDVISSSSGEDDSHVAYINAEILNQEFVVKLDYLKANRLKHLRIRHALCPWQVIRIEVEDQVRAQPPLLLHRWRVRGLVVGARIVRMSRNPTREKGVKIPFLRESEVPLNDPGGPEHEAELAPPETVWKRRFGSIVVAVELGFEELGRRFLRAIWDRHGAPSESRP